MGGTYRDLCIIDVSVSGGWQHPMVTSMEAHSKRLSEPCTLPKKAGRRSDYSGRSGSSRKPAEQPKPNLPKT